MILAPSQPVMVSPRQTKALSRSVLTGNRRQPHRLLIALLLCQSCGKFLPMNSLKKLSTGEPTGGVDGQTAKGNTV